MLYRAISFVLALLLVGVIAIMAMTLSVRSPRTYRSTRDEATVDEATPDTATPDVATPDAVIPTEEATEAATEPQAPTETPTIKQEVETTAEPITNNDNSAEPVIAEEPKVIEEPQQDIPVDYSDNDLDLLARVIWAEAGGCSEYCQWLVASATMNLADDLGDGTLESIVYNPNIVYISSSTPSEQCYRVAARVLSGDRDYQVKAFRNNYYHDFGTPYTSVDNVYFSTY